MAFEFFFGFEFESLFSIWKFLVFIFSEKKKPKFSKRGQLLRLTLVLTVRGVNGQRYMYGGLLEVVAYKR